MLHSRAASLRFLVPLLFVSSFLLPSLATAEPFTPMVFSDWMQKSKTALGEKDFGQLETMYSEMRRYEAQADEPFYLDYFYRSLGTVRNMYKMLVWTDEKPGSDLAWTLLGKGYISQAWEFRGTKSSQDVPQAAWKPFNANLKKAEQCFDTAVKLNPANSYAWTYYIILDKALGLGDASMESHFQKAVEAQPDCMSAYVEKGDYLKPKWRGTSARYRRFIQGVLEGAPAGSPLRLLETDLIEETLFEISPDGSDQQKLMKAPQTWKRIQTAFETYLEAHPKADIVRARYCWRAWFAGHNDIAKKQLEAMKDEKGPIWEWGGWGDPTSFQNARQALYGQPYYPPNIFMNNYNPPPRHK